MNTKSPVLIAFIRTREGYLIKAYDEGADIRCPINRNDSYWFSKWAGDVRGSVVRALEETARRIGSGGFDAGDIAWV